MGIRGTWHKSSLLFANETTCLAGRVYPTRPDSLGVDLFVRRGRVRLKSLDVWEMGSIWAAQAE